MRNMVEHGHTNGSRETIVLSGCSLAMRCTMWISVPMPSAAPGGRGLDPVQDPLGGPDLVGDHHGLVRALGVHDHLTAGVLGSERLGVLRAETLVHGAPSAPEQERGLLDLVVLVPAELGVRVPHEHLGLGVTHVDRSVPTEVLVREEQDLVAAVRVPTRGSPGRSKRCRRPRRAHRRTPSAPRRSSCR